MDGPVLGVFANQRVGADEAFRAYLYAVGNGAVAAQIAGIADLDIPIDHDMGAQISMAADPAPVAEWLPELAAMLGARRPMRVPRFIGRLAAGQAGVVLMTELRGASNEKAKRDAGKTPTKVVDPVCHMMFDPENAAGSSKYQGTTYYFCATSCKTKFDADPRRYVGSRGLLDRIRGK